MALIEPNKSGGIGREQVWLTAWCHVAMSDNCVHIESPARWADECLRAFDERFMQVVTLPPDSAERP